MRRFSMTCLAIAAVLMPLVSTVAQESGPRAVPVEPIKDFETVPRGDYIHHEFQLKNEGGSVLEIIDVKPACGCTVAEFDKKIEPGKLGKVKVKLETSSFSGPIAKPISVFTNDPQNPKLQLVIKAEVKPYLGIQPGYARFIYVRGEALEPIPQVVWAADGSDIQVSNVKTPYDYLKVEYRTAKDEERNDDYKGRQLAVEVHLAPDAPVGALRDYVELEIDHPKQKTVRIPISGFVRPRQHVTPQKIDFGHLDGGSLPLKRVVTFTNFIAAGIKVTDFESGLEGLSVEVNEVGKLDGHRFELVLTVGPEVPKGKFESTLKLHITDEKNPIVEVPVSGTIL